MNLKIVSAGAGSGKTFRLMSEMVELLQSGTVQPEGIIATTFTKKAAAELEERVRVRLLEEGMTELADRLSGSLIGTVHGLGVKLLKRFCFEAGVSPDVDIIADEDQNIFFNQSLATILTQERVERMEILTERLALRKVGMGQTYDWRQDVKDIVDRARANGFGIEKLEESKVFSYQSLAELYPVASPRSAEHFETRLTTLLQQTLDALEANDADSTKATNGVKQTIQKYLNQIKKGDRLTWYDWVALSKAKTGAKSKDIVEELQEFAKDHEQHPDFLPEIKAFIDHIFDIAIKAIEEYEKFKQKRGLIDYIDMETHVKRLLDNPEVHAVLKEEIDLLMVDEFQDTSPIQLEIFWKLTQMANHSIWVGDPKQSIYGFRGAEPELMQAIIEKTGGIKPEDIQEFSWRSREDLVHASNALFVKAFPKLPEERIALIPKRRLKTSEASSNNFDEPIEMGTALQHWHYEHEGGKKTPPGRPWMEKCIARSVRHLLERKLYVNAGGDDYRPVKAGDIAILCRSNKQCLEMAAALHHQGLKASIARNGLLETPEAKLVLSCLKYLLNPYDSLSVAEITFLASSKPLEEIIDSRIQWMEARAKEDNAYLKWESENQYIERLDELRSEITELSGAETLNLILEDLDLRRIVVAWGNPEQRCDNVDMLRQFADRYEDACNRLHTGASLGGFLLWLNDLAGNEQDAQGSSEQEDAVNILTYHRSKGLEWPVVIMHSLENGLRDSIWGATVASESDEVNLEQLSANRFIRFWRHPYGRQFKKTNLEQRLDASETKKKAINKALEEEARLMYVGITRARDYLVFTSRKKNMNWLNRIWQGPENEDQPTLDPNSFETPWIWKGDTMMIDNEVEMLPVTLEHHPRPAEEIMAQPERVGKQLDVKPYYIDSDKDNFYQEYGYKMGVQAQWGTRFRDPEDVSPYVVSKVIQSFLSYDLPEYTDGQRMAAAERIISRFKLQDDLSYMEVLAHARSFMEWVDDNLQPNNWYKHFPIRLMKERRQFDTEIDMLLENDRMVAAIIHDSFSGSHTKWKKQANEHATWFYLVQSALQKLYPDKKVRLFIHFVLTAGTQEINVEVRNYQKELF